MKKLKKRKLALATAIATLTASLSIFSSVPTSARFYLDQLVVISNLESSNLLVTTPQDIDMNQMTDSSYSIEHDVRFCFYIMYAADPMFSSVVERAKPGDIIQYFGDGNFGTTDMAGINIMGYDSDGAVEIVGSVFDTPIGNFDAVTIGDETLMQMTDGDGAKYVFESEVTCDDVEQFIWRKSTDEYRKEEHAIWVLPNEDGDVNSDNEVNSADAAVILEDIAMSAVGDTGKMNASENLAADVNGDGIIDAQDAAVVLSYTSEVGSGMLEGVTLKAYAAQ
ncbi:MAG: hypothetical protein K2G25_09090 [Oscillospiraceae bacterium]|nr:hypothetical protein [Oscillospiraceae bacterium]